MPIIQNQPNTDNSPWYDIMEDRANTWNEFAINNQLEINGYYNANIVTFEIKNLEFEISGIRQVSNVTSLSIFSLGSISEEFKFVFKSSIIDKKNFTVINRGSLWNFFRFKYRFYNKKRKLRIYYNNENEHLKLKNTKILEFEHFRKLIINKNKVKLVLHELPDNYDIIDSFLNFCKTLNKKV